MKTLPRMKRLALQRSAGARRRSGFTLIEVSILVMVLGLGLLATTSTSMTVHTLRAADAERRTAVATLEAITEDVRRIAATSVGEGWGTALVDAYDLDGQPGPFFNVLELDVPEGETANGTVTIITDETLTDTEVGAALGMPRDLDLDGFADNEDVAADARLLPVVIRLRWAGVNGDREIVEGLYVLGF